MSTHNTKEKEQGFKFMNPDSKTCKHFTFSKIVPGDGSVQGEMEISFRPVRDIIITGLYGSSLILDDGNSSGAPVPMRVEVTDDTAAGGGEAASWSTPFDSVVLGVGVFTDWKVTVLFEENQSYIPFDVRLKAGNLYRFYCRCSDGIPLGDSCYMNCQIEYKEIPL